MNPDYDIKNFFEIEKKDKNDRQRHFMGSDRNAHDDLRKYFEESKINELIYKYLWNFQFRPIGSSLSEVHYQRNPLMKKESIIPFLNDLALKKELNHIVFFMYRDRIYLQEIDHWYSLGENKVSKIYLFLISNLKVKELSFVKVNDKKFVIKFKDERNISKELSNFLDNTYFEEFEFFTENGVIYLREIYGQELENKRENHEVAYKVSQFN